MSNCNAFDSSLFGNCLTDLSFSELLTLKQSLEKLSFKKEIIENRYTNFQDIHCPDNANKTCMKPSTLALVAEERGYTAANVGSEPWQPAVKPSKLQTLFQISVTALAFLSFGGYLMCLIIQSIKNKGTNYFHPAATTMATTNGVKRIKVYRRNRRSSLPPIESTQKYNYYSHYNSDDIKNNPYQYYQKKIGQ